MSIMFLFSSAELFKYFPVYYRVLCRYNAGYLIANCSKRILNVFIVFLMNVKILQCVRGKLYKNLLNNADENTGRSD
jgi:hypothetical protein